MSRVIVYGDLASRLLAANLGYLIKWPNTPFQMPPDLSPYLVVEVSGGSSRAMELSGSIWEVTGQAWVHILVATNTGPDVAFAIQDSIEAIFRGPPIEPVIYDQISNDSGSTGTEDGNYWRTSVSADWRLQTYVQRTV